MKPDPRYLFACNSGMLRKILQYSATIRDGRDDDSGSGGGIKKTVAIVAHRRGTYPSDEAGEGIFNPQRWL
ncbi:MAG: hypothetical protein KHX36_08175 [Clostridiales bacterium]|nr:hypothetical protein [Clostridiales bacterium]